MYYNLKNEVNMCALCEIISTRLGAIFSKNGQKMKKNLNDDDTIKNNI